MPTRFRAGLSSSLQFSFIFIFFASGGDDQKQLNHSGRANSHPRHTWICQELTFKLLQWGSKENPEKDGLAFADLVALEINLSPVELE